MPALGPRQPRLPSIVWVPEREPRRRSEHSRVSSVYPYAHSHRALYSQIHPFRYELRGFFNRILYPSERSYRMPLGASQFRPLHYEFLHDYPSFSSQKIPQSISNFFKGIPFASGSSSSKKILSPLTLTNRAPILLDWEALASNSSGNFSLTKFQ